MKRILVLFILALSWRKTSGQNCLVMVDSLKGNYKGGCKGGLANGEGTATGADIYTGRFKDGYPEGKGKYNWQNGSWYEGQWKKGAYDGEGILHLVKNGNSNGQDFSGIWKDGKYVGSGKKPFLVYSITNKISEYGLRMNKGSNLNEVIINVYDILNGANSFSTPNEHYIPKKKLTNIQIAGGSFTNMDTDEKSSYYNNMYKLMGVVFPLHVQLYFDMEMMDVEIFEKGSWNVNVKLEIMN